MAYVERIYTFRCPECQNEFTYNEPGEPLCDGPGDTKSHNPKVMRRIRVKDKDLGTKEVSAAEGEMRAKGTLLTPETLIGMKAKVKGHMWVPKDGVNPLTGEEMDDREEPDHDVEVH